MYRFLKGSANYAKKINITPEQLATMSQDDIDNFVKGSISSVSMSKDETQAFNEFTKSIFGSDTTKSSTIPKYDPATQKLQRNNKTGEYRVINK